MVVRKRDGWKEDGEGISEGRAELGKGNPAEFLGFAFDIVQCVLLFKISIVSSFLRAVS